MIDQDCLSPQEASYIAHNAYFTLKDWMSGQPTIGMAARTNVRKMVTGDGMGAVAPSGGANTSLRGTGLGGTKLQSVFAGSANGTSTGFGYVLSFNRDGRRHVVVATRGTRAEHSKADLYTDARASMASMAGIGPVHHGFRNTFGSVRSASRVTTGESWMPTSALRRPQPGRCGGHARCRAFRGSRQGREALHLRLA